MGCKSVRGSCGTIDSQHRFFRAKQVAQGNLFGHELFGVSIGCDSVGGDDGEKERLVSA